MKKRAYRKVNFEKLSPAEKKKYKARLATQRKYRTSLGKSEVMRGSALQSLVNELAACERRQVELIEKVVSLCKSK